MAQLNTLRGFAATALLDVTCSSCWLTLYAAGISLWLSYLTLMEHKCKIAKDILTH